MSHCKVINFVDYSLNQGAPVGHKSAETLIGHESNGAVAGDRTPNQMVSLPLPLLGMNHYGISGEGDEWTLDSRCSYKMSPNRDWFTTYQPINGGKVWVYILKHKNDVFGKFKQWKAMIEKQTRKQIKRLRTDNGMEFCGEKVNEFCKNKDKLEPRARKCIFFGYANGVKGYRKEQLHTKNDPNVREKVEFVTKASKPIENMISTKPKDVAKSIEKEVPQTYHEAMTSRQFMQWIIAMNKEIESLQKNHTWQLVEKPKNQKIVGCKWLFKRNEEILREEDARFKTRLVEKGHTQKEGVDFNEVFSPVVKHSSIRVLVAMIKYIKKVLEHFEMQGLKPMSTPLVAHFKLSSTLSPQTEKKREYMSHVPYASAVGSMKYAIVYTRPNIPYAVSVVSRYMDRPRKINW
ncbi:Retrovirus-related Pol polyprotein from transposon TNT 1-94 [Vitis vinifera]|uniref:Retrovirus-related Pol polyprotein from transposon TNT 1-94 n=1 Tax=Vitis vinifera TaxID=29760 RepID=A0A438I2X4_VITVI|nr:Retrovirus-related Pol polyprotein from transposon TNT 1-94 [Vitis vinifera]